MTDSFDAADFIAGFIVEAEEHLGAGAKGLLEIADAAERGKAAPRQVRELYRSLHTLKGLAAMVDVEPIVGLAHALESTLRDADAAGGRLSVEGADLVAEGLRAIETRVGDLQQGRPVQAAPRELLGRLAVVDVDDDEAAGKAATLEEDEVLSRLDAAEREMLEQGLDAGKSALRLDFSPSDERYNEGTTITAIRGRVESVGELVKVVPRSVPRSSSAPSALTFSLLFLARGSLEELREKLGAAPGELRVLDKRKQEEAPPEVDEAALMVPEVAEAPAFGRGVVRVDVARLDEALERLSDLVLARFRLEAEIEALAQRGADVRRLKEFSSEHRRQVRALRAAIMRARTVKVAEMLERLPLLVRGLAKERRKKVVLALEPGREELDKAVAERLFPAVVHLVRNAIDHGLESPEERRAHNKPEEGTLSIRCSTGARGFLEFLIEDDGRGIDKARVAEQAGTPAPKDDDELLRLLRRPGLSTRTTVDRTSGRGLGVDIVLRVVEDLGGEVTLATTEGQGTTFALKVPLSISIIEGLVVSAARERYVIPSAIIDEIVEVEPARLAHPPGAERSGISLYERRGVTMPFVRLRRLVDAPIDEISREKAVVVRRHNELFAFGVDRVLAQQEVVVRRLEDPLIRVAGIVGAADLGDGRPALVIDPIALVGKTTSVEEKRP